MADRILPALPRLTYQEDGCVRLLDQLKSLGFNTLYCESGAHIQMGKEAGFSLVGGPYLNLTNSAALLEAEKAGLSAAVLSPEGKLGQLSRLSANPGFPVEYMPMVGWR